MTLKLLPLPLLFLFRHAKTIELPMNATMLYAGLALLIIGVFRLVSHCFIILYLYFSIYTTQLMMSQILQDLELNQARIHATFQ